MVAQTATSAQRYHKIDNVRGDEECRLRPFHASSSPSYADYIVSFGTSSDDVHIQQPFRAWGGWALPQMLASLTQVLRSCLSLPGANDGLRDGTVDAAHELVSRLEVETKCLTITGNEQTGWFPSLL
jgi:hypothetical protein